MTAALSLPDRREWTVDDLTGLSNDFRYELVNGRLLVTSPIGPHQDLSHEVVSAQKANRPPGFGAFHELSVLIDRHNQPRPDVAVVKQREYARAGVPYYWVINPLRGPVTLTELVLDPDRPTYQARTATSGVFETDQPWPVRLDLPALTRQYERLLAEYRGVPAAQ